MSDTALQLTRKQQEILLRGLRYVKSSVALEVQEYSDEVDAKRQNSYQEISRIESLVNGARIVETVSV